VSNVVVPVLDHLCDGDREAGEELVQLAIDTEFVIPWGVLHVEPHEARLWLSIELGKHIVARE